MTKDNDPISDKEIIFRYCHKLSGIGNNQLYKFFFLNIYFIFQDISNLYVYYMVHGLDYLMGLSLSYPTSSLYLYLYLSSVF